MDLKEKSIHPIVSIYLVPWKKSFMGGGQWTPILKSPVFDLESLILVENASTDIFQWIRTT